MHPWSVPVDAELLRRLYVDERLTILEIATRLGCRGTTILRRLRRFEIQARPRGPRVTSSRSSLAWSPELAWAIGLIATDGNLSPDGRHLSIPSKDLDLLESLRSCLGLQNRVVERVNGKGHIYRLQWGDRGFYDWLLSIGLTPAKSLTLGPLVVPDEYFADFFRGCIDGDGSILVYTDRYHAAKNERYVYQRLYVSLVSASRPFVEWIQRTVRALVGIQGVVNVKKKQGYRPLWVLRYAKTESLRVLRWMYYSPHVPSLSRKRHVAAPFLIARVRPPRCGPGRPMVL